MQTQHPDIVSGFKHNILPQLPIPNVTPQIQLPPPQMQSVIDDAVAIAPVIAAATSTISIFGSEFQKKYVYIALVLIVGLIIFFAYKWYTTPNKKNKKGKQQKIKDDSESEESEEDNINEENDNGDDSDEEIPIYKK